MVICEILDSGFHDTMWIPDPRYWIQESTSVDFRFQKVCFPGFWTPRPEFEIPKSRILDSTNKYFLDSGFHKQIFSGFRIPFKNVSWILESGLQSYMRRNIDQRHLYWWRLFDLSKALDLID